MTQPDFSPSADRNKHPILEVLQQYLPSQGSALEIASGTGQHIVWFAQQLPDWTWQPSEVHRGALYNIEVRVAQAGLTNVRDAIQLNVCNAPWFAPPETTDTSLPTFDLVFCANMLHIAPWDACFGLMTGAARHLNENGILVTYGPYFEIGVEATPSNLEFDQSLRQHNPDWGIRQLEEVAQEAARAGLRLSTRHALPANNLLLVWGKP